MDIYNEHEDNTTPRTTRAKASKTHTDRDRPEWMDARGVHQRFSISKSTLYRLAAEGKIRAVSLRERGKLRGKKLYSADSIAAFIESMEKGGEK